MKKNLKVLFFGLGSIGQRHLRILNKISRCEIYAFRTGLGQLDVNENIQELHNWEEVDQHSFDVAFITNPSDLHIQTAIECANRQMALFIEKPLDVTRVNLDELLKRVKQHELTSYVAFCMRYHPVLMALKDKIKNEKIIYSKIQCVSFFPNWRPGQDHLKSYTAQQAKSGGILFELAHEIDYAQFLFGNIKELTGRTGKIADVTLDADDFADILITHEDCKSSVHLNFFSHETQRTIEVYTTEHYFKADLVSNDLTIITKTGISDTISFNVERDDLFEAQLKDFLSNLHVLDRPNNLFEASSLHEKILAFRSNQ